MPDGSPSFSRPATPAMDIRHDWSVAEVQALLDLPFPELMFQAQAIHRATFDPTEIQISTLLSIKTGAARKIAPIAPRAPCTKMA